MRLSFQLAAIRSTNKQKDIHTQTYRQKNRQTDSQADKEVLKTAGKHTISSKVAWHRPTDRYNKKWIDDFQNDTETDRHNMINRQRAYRPLATT